MSCPRAGRIREWLLQDETWCNAVRKLKSKEEVSQVSGTGHITKLKSIFCGAGPIYSRLSDLAHVAPKTHSRFMAEANGGMMIRIRAPAAARESVRLLLVLLDAFLVVSEICFQNAGIACENIDPSTLALREDRVVPRLIALFDRVLPPGTKTFFDTWWK